MTDLLFLMVKFLKTLVLSVSNFILISSFFMNSRWTRSGSNIVSISWAKFIIFIIL